MTRKFVLPVRADATKKDVKLSELMLALRFLGIEEAEDPGKIMSIHIDPLTVTVIAASLDEEGRRFVASPNEIATDTASYRIDNDL